MKPLSAETFAWLLGLVVIAVVTVVAFLYIGWFGIFLIGILGMTVTSNMELHGSHAVTTDVKMYALQLKEQENSSSSEKRLAATRKAKQSRLIYILNTIWLAMIALGLAMFSIHQI